MDVAKYIGLFLLKNNFCYIHGLGNLELRKLPATYDGEALQPPKYEVVITATGSIDDSLANFIANNEQISISKASNALRDFSTQAKADLQDGKEVVIPAIGKFVDENNKIRFISDPNLQYTPPAIPTIKHAPRQQETIPVQQPESKSTFNPKQTEQQPKAEPTFRSAAPPPPPAPSGGRLNWGRIILVIVLLAVIVAAVIFGMRYLQSRNDNQPNVIMSDSLLNNTPPSAAAPVVADTTAVDSAASVGQVSQQNGMLKFKVIVNTYDNETAAEKRVRQLKSYGNSVEMYREDSMTYFVLMPVTAAPADTANLLDSLRRFYNPDGVSIY